MEWNAHRPSTAAIYLCLQEHYALVLQSLHLYNYTWNWASSKDRYAYHRKSSLVCWPAWPDACLHKSRIQYATRRCGRQRLWQVKGTWLCASTNLLMAISTFLNKASGTRVGTKPSENSCPKSQYFWRTGHEPRRANSCTLCIVS
ncbi:hypothetical protein AC578_7700 [Pseudocercospora eumusae]|uniref:Uncharacterized protein n=1 Tax=Pseudocercospora eumusae TaxID=321146 RepID=A0A139HLA5_9PEZI|nr:hypothetical protein AC578_7700 [Pseudocercospora eumusae]